MYAMDDELETSGKEHGQGPAQGQGLGLAVEGKTMSKVVTPLGNIRLLLKQSDNPLFTLYQEYAYLIPPGGLPTYPSNTPSHTPSHTPSRLSSHPLMLSHTFVHTLQCTLVPPLFPHQHTLTHPLERPLTPFDTPISKNALMTQLSGLSVSFQYRERGSSVPPLLHQNQG